MLDFLSFLEKEKAESKLCSLSNYDVITISLSKKNLIICLCTYSQESEIIFLIYCKEKNILCRIWNIK